MSDRDRLLDTLPHVQPSHFASIAWPDWSDIVYSQESSGDPVKVFMHGIMYVAQALQMDSVKDKLGKYTNLYLANWNPSFDEAQFEEIVRGDHLMFATFHSGAVHMIGRLRADMTEELARDGLGECVDALEVGVHRQFLTRFAGIPEIVGEIECGDMLNKLMKKLEDEEGQSVGAGHVVELEGKDGGETGIQEGGEEDVDSAVPEKKPGRARKRAKSKKAKEAKKASKKGKGTTSN
jgi:hypothetical protein